ncbi:diacylglycerol kinase family lipid kinase [Calidifontibacter sp. DB0510]|uniref:Diacylglycerol kinase family lipid kinase n=1 Tax=Metallococcus carri TaxID=1656884 RepID=A0A967B3A6_9MICO|nr:diacylglycerol kinase family protein [Metallococcus carri]NHN57232.1 diacylglycerol kinase family lipid kinase [Metallococcus carri]NOP37965.1 diacylglycerol kinase family lipid kinase [Calidifontibacter sp. DB2511S]
MKRSAVVINPVKVRDLRAVKQEISAIFWGYGWAEPLYLETTVAEPGVSQSRRAVDEGVDMVCALGGDGTVRCVATPLLHTGIPLGVLASGTGNLLSRNLGLPRSVPDAVRVALSGQSRQIDAMQIDIDRDGDGLYEEPQFGLVMSGIGLDAEILAATDESLKTKIGWLAYPMASRAYLRRRPVPMTVTHDGTEVSRDPLTAVIVGSCGMLQGGITLMPDAQVDDGLLDAVSLRVDNLRAWVPLIAHTSLRRRGDSRQLSRSRARSIDVRTEDAAMIEIDGDIAGRARAIRATVLPGALVVRVR